jgi:hypothetical protein
MTLENFIASIESEWEPEGGFFWSIRQGYFRQPDFDRALAKMVAVPSASSDLIPARLVSVLWYVPIFMHWQTERVKEGGGSASEYEVATNKMTAEVERILGVP